MSSFLALYHGHPFLCGMVTGIIGVLILIVAVFLFWRSRPRKISCVSYQYSKGTISIRTQAIADLVHSMENDYKEFSFYDTQILTYKKQTFIRQFVDYRDKERPFPEAAADFQIRLLQKLDASYGVKNVQKVEVVLKSKVK